MGVNESRTLEYKESLTNSFLKTVSAYANYGGGKVVFGIKDNGEIIGLSDLKGTSLAIENKINDSISPMPEYKLFINEEDSFIELIVSEGYHKPYFYRSKAYKRADTATVEVDRIELTRLILEGSNKNYEELPASDQGLSFEYLESRLRANRGISALSVDILKSLDLYSDADGYNVAAETLADQNNHPGIDAVRFGATINEFMDRGEFKNESVLKQYNDVIEMFEKYYCYDKIVGSERIKIELIPEDAFREAVANAIVHRQWDMQVDIRILMHKDKIEVVSPGGLPRGLTVSEYLNGQISMLRNPILGSVFYRLRYIEKFGTGIMRIKQAYEHAVIQPEFKVFDNSISIVLPLVSEPHVVLTKDEQTIYGFLLKDTMHSRKDIELKTGFSKDKAIRVLNQMIRKNVIAKQGQNKNTVYFKKV